MLSRAFTKPMRRSPRDGSRGGSKSQSIDDQYDLDAIAGWFMDDLPLVFCDPLEDDDRDCDPTLRDVLRSSVGVIGEGRLGMTEKIVFLQCKLYALKRFRKLSVGKREFGRKIERLAQVSRRCEYLVPVTAYLYAKRIKFVLCDYYPMGSLADLLAGGRKGSQTALDWNQRFNIVFHISRAIAFIHSQSPTRDKHVKLNVHGNIKSTNVMIDIDFTARLSDYGFVQLAEPLVISDNTTKSQSDYSHPRELSQNSDIYDFGVMILDLLGGDKDTYCVEERKEELRNGKCEFFEFAMGGKEMKQALQVLNIALACVNKLPEARPSIHQILYLISEML